MVCTANIAATTYPDLTASEHDLVLEAVTSYRSGFTVRMS
jgi:hypothetical protein